MKCIFYYFEDEFPLKLCPAHRSTQCKGKVGCRGLWAGRRKVIQAEEQHPQRSEALHIQERGASIVQLDLLIPSTKSSCRGPVISHNFTAIACLLSAWKGSSSVRTPLQGLSSELDNIYMSRQSQELTILPDSRNQIYGLSLKPFLFVILLLCFKYKQQSLITGSFFLKTINSNNNKILSRE